MRFSKHVISSSAKIHCFPCSYLMSIKCFLCKINMWHSIISHDYRFILFVNVQISKIQTINLIFSVPNMCIIVETWLRWISFAKSAVLPVLLRFSSCFPLRVKPKSTCISLFNVHPLIIFFFIYQNNKYCHSKCASYVHYTIKEQLNKICLRITLGNRCKIYNLI